MRLINKKHLAVREVVSTDGSRYVLNGVLVSEIEINGKAAVRTVATNGRALAMVEGITPASEDFPQIAEIDNAPNGAKRAIIPNETVKRMVAAIPKTRRGTLPILSNGVLKMSEKEITFACTDLDNKSIIPSRVVEGNYPAYEAVIPTATPKATVKLSPELLTMLLKAAIESTGGVGVTFHVYGEMDAVKLTAENKDEKFTGVIMPMK